MNPAHRILAIALLFLGSSGGAVLMYFALVGNRAELQYATMLPEPSELPNFSLSDHEGNAFTRDDLLGDWNLVFFGFTNCPDICPATLGRLGIARTRVEEAGGTFPGIILISVDPERDTVKAMSDYVGQFGAGFKGVTGALDQLELLTRSLGIYFAKSGDVDGAYSVDHSAVVLLFNESGEWQALFGAPHTVDAFVQDVPVLTGQR